MKKYSLIAAVIFALTLLVLSSLTNIVGYQIVQASQQSIIKERSNPRELLFQTIVDIANNKEIRSIILKYQIKGFNFYHPDVKFPSFVPQFFTKNQFKLIYLVGFFLSRSISKARIHSLLEQYQMNIKWLQKEISIVIENDATLNAAITQLQTSDCDCKNEIATQWNFNLLCSLILFPLYGLARLIEIGYNIYFPVIVMLIIGSIFNCFWAYWP